MHGVIPSELKKYVEAKGGTEAWSRVLRAAGGREVLYVAVGQYPDREVLELFGAAARTVGKPLPEFLEGFGEFLASDLFRMYAGMIDPRWRTLELLENVDHVIHRVTSAKNPGARRPDLQTTRRTPDEVVILYTSGRKLCGLAKGLIRGTATHYGEKAVVVEGSCMLKGSSVCTFTVTINRKA